MSTGDIFTQGFDYLPSYKRSPSHLGFYVKLHCSSRRCIDISIITVYHMANTIAVVDVAEQYNDNHKQYAE